MEEIREECRAEKQGQVVRMSDKVVRREIDKVMSKVEAEVCHALDSYLPAADNLYQISALHNRTGMEYMVLTLHSKVTDTWPTRVFTSGRVRFALMNLHKSTDDTFALKLQGFMISGVTGKHSKHPSYIRRLTLIHRALGAIKATKTNTLSTLRTMIRDDVTTSLRAFLVKTFHYAAC